LRPDFVHTANESKKPASVANPKFVLPWSEARNEFRIQNHTTNLLNLVWFTDLKFLNADAMEITGTSNPPHDGRVLKRSAGTRSSGGLDHASV
jgi:hypothetical protein